MSTLSEAPLLRIGDRWEAGAHGHYDVIDPATEEPIGGAPQASVEQAREAARAAREAQPAFAATTPEERSAWLARAADLVEARSEKLVPLVIAETGCTAVVGRQMQVPVAVDRLRAYARYALDSNVVPLPPQEMSATPLAPGGLIGALARRLPVGVVACITPYNFPIVNLVGKLGPALAMGNSVVIRPAPQDPLAVVELVRILDEAGFPPGVVNLVTGSTPDTGEALVESPDVDMVSFTGSTAVGQRIAEVGGCSMKRLLLELGGKGAALVLEDADVPNAVRMISSTWSFHSGQICTAPTRAIVARPLFDELVEGLAQVARSLAVGDPHDPATVVGPVISAAQRDRVERFVATARSEGGEIVCGGERPTTPERGFYAAPTLIRGTPEMQVAREEVFGPVVVALPFESEDEAVAIANGTEFGLYDYVFSADTARALRLSERLRSGNIGINTTQRNHFAPFGGMKQSGVGRDGGRFGLEAYSELQSVVWPG